MVRPRLFAQQPFCWKHFQILSNIQPSLDGRLRGQNVTAMKHQTIRGTVSYSNVSLFLEEARVICVQARVVSPNEVNEGIHVWKRIFKMFAQILIERTRVNVTAIDY